MNFAVAASQEPIDYALKKQKETFSSQNHHNLLDT